MPRSQAVSNALDPKIQGAPNGFRARAFAGMSGKVQAVLGTVRINVAKKFGACLLLVAPNSETGDTTVLVADRELSYPLRFQRAELTPSAAAEISSSRIARSVSPTGERTRLSSTK